MREGTPVFKTGSIAIPTRRQVSHSGESNTEPDPYKGAALPIVLEWHGGRRRTLTAYNPRYEESYIMYIMPSGAKGIRTPSLLLAKQT